MKSKKDRFNSLFISMNKRLPPDNETKILFKSEDGHYGTSTGQIINAQQRQLKSGMEVPVNLKHTGYYAIEWTVLY